MFPEFEETIRGEDDFNASFGKEGVDITFAQYEIAPYAAGMPGFLIGYELLAPYLNARGERLLGALQ